MVDTTDSTLLTKQLLEIVVIIWTIIALDFSLLSPTPWVNVSQFKNHIPGDWNASGLEEMDKPRVASTFNAGG